MKSQLNLVRSLMAKDRWWTLQSLRICVQIAGKGISEAAVSARIRDLRKPQYGGHQVLRRKTDWPGVFEYKMVVDMRRGERRAPQRWNEYGWKNRRMAERRTTG